MTDPAAALTGLIAEMVAAEVERQLAGRADAESPWMTADECAAYLRCPVKRVRNLTSRGEIPVVREGRRVLYDRREVDAWLRSDADYPWRPRGATVRHDRPAVAPAGRDRAIRTSGGSS